jgi:WD40 repeat protein
MNERPPAPDPHVTHVLPGIGSKLARLAFAEFSVEDPLATVAPRHLALLPPEALDLDLDDPAQCCFGDYELLAKIGQGGMGVVYRARQISLDREVAVKLLATGPWASNDFVERFKREAQSAARMQHPNIVAIYEIGSHDQLNFFSMRLVHGLSLAQVLVEHGAYAPSEAASLLRRIAEAVDYAHRLGVLHLDLKPANILLDERGEPQVADFGLARRLDEIYASDSDEVSGTPSYMAPEQAQLKSHKLSPATDIYGLGAILYELLTGTPPFLGATPQDTLERVVRDEPPSIRARRSEISADLEAICLKCLAKNPRERYGSAHELSEDLGRFLEGRAVSVRPLNALQRLGRWARREPKLAAAASIAVFALLVGLAATSFEWRRAEHSAGTSQNLLWQSRREAALRLEQDGKGIGALPQLLANITEQERAGKPDAVALERRRVGMLLGQGATLIDRIVVADANPLGAEISPDGSLLALSFNDQSVRWYDTSTLTERGRVSLVDRVSSEGKPRAITLLRFVDNHRLRATFDWYTNIVSPSDDETWLIDLDRAKLVEPPMAFADFAEATYSADGCTALLRNHKAQLQLWQVQPWRPLSALITTPSEEFQPWLLDSKGHFAAYLTVAMRQLIFYDLPDPSTPHPIDLPHNAGISSWTLSDDGRVLALGDYEGRIFLLDTVARKVRTLPTTRGREITSIAFSEDDAWLATASFDGAVHAFDVASGDSLVFGQMDHDFAVQRVGLSHDKRLLIAASDGKVALWHLPLRGPRALPAQRVGFGPAPHGLAGRFPIGWSLKAGLLASTGMDGQIRLWRLPAPPMIPAMAAREIPFQTWFDGRRLVDVEWDRLRIVATNGAALTPWMQLPQPPTFAELLDNGELLVTTTGPQLRIYDSSTLRARVPPIALDASPQQFLGNADGSRVLLSFGGNGPDGFHERLQLYNARTGMRLPGEAVLRGPLRRLAFSADSAYILAVGPTEASTVVLATTGLHRVGEYPHDPYTPVKWADFTAGGNVLMVTSPPDARQDNDTLLTWDPASDRVRAKQSIGQIRSIGVIATNTGEFVTGINQDLVVPPAGSIRLVERLARSEPLSVLALSPDRRLLAHAFRREVQLYDVDNAVAIGPPLQGDSDAIDIIMQLAFSPDGSKLLARTQEGHWLLWPIAVEQRTVKDIDAQLSRLNIGNENQQTVLMPSAGERTALRARDTGSWLLPAVRPVPAHVSLSEEGLPIPARASGASPLLLDLGPYYDFAPESVRNTFYNIVPAMRPRPVGVQRIGGVDYDLRGMVQLGAATNGAAPKSIHCLALPPGPLAALHLLLTASLGSPAPTGQILAHATLHYVDGGSAQLPIRAGQEAPGYSGNDLGVPMVFYTHSGLFEMGLDTQGDVLSAPLLVNPQPQRPVKCMDLDADTAAVLLLGITAEPAGPAIVIPADVSSINMQQGAVSRPAATTVRTPARRSP